MAGAIGDAAAGAGDAVLRVLFVEDNTGDLRLVTEALGESGSVGFFVTPSARLRVAIERLGTERFDAVLLDLELPDSHGLDTVVRLLAAAPEVPTVVLTAVDDEELGSLAVMAGAQAYLVKGRIEGRALRRTVRYAIQRHRLEDQLRRAASTSVIGTVCHELAPGLDDLLTVIAGFTQLLLARESDVRTVRDLELIASATDRATSLVRRLGAGPGP